MTLSGAFCAAEVTHAPSTLYATRIKRLLDILFSATAIVVFLPVMAIVAVAVWLVLGWPILFHDERAGLYGRPFRIVKFRSMSNATNAAGSLLPDAVRLGRFGRVLRRTSLDELPQLASVFAGDMSLIGPRPLPTRYVSRYSKNEATRLLVRPGLTGWAQIHGRNAIDWPERLRLDAKYIDMLRHPSAPLVDLFILVITIPQVAAQAIAGRGISLPGHSTMPEYAPDHQAGDAL